LTDHYGAAQAAIHHERFGALAAQAAADLLDLLAGAGLATGTVLDLGCGSGILARIVGDAGYAVTGVDISADMITLARSEAPGATLTVGSAHDVEVPDGCVGVTAIGEVLNYATDDRAGIRALTTLAAKVHAALAPGGTWLLDLSGPGRCGPQGVAKQFHRADRWCLGMIATEDAAARRLDREISIFTELDGRWDRTDEHHVLHLYEPDEVAAILSDVGFAVDVEDGYRTPGAHPAAMPGWYVVRATKPADGTG
jgi:SAM-dependent methyltransferase